MAYVYFAAFFVSCFFTADSFSIFFFLKSKRFAKDIWQQNKNMPVLRRELPTGIVFMLCAATLAQIGAQSIPATLAAEPIVPFAGIVAALCALSGWIMGRWRAKKMLEPSESKVKK